MAISRSAARAARLIAAARAEADAAIKEQIRADAFVANFVEMSPQQVIDYVNANVTTVAGARALLGKMGVMLLLLAKREYRG